MGFLLLLLIVVPIAGAGVGALLHSARAARAWAMGVALLTMVLGAIVAIGHFAGDDLTGTSGSGQYYRVAWQAAGIESIGFTFKLGVDAISVWLVLLTVFLQPLATASSFSSIVRREKEYYAWMTLLLGAMLGVFVARDALLFYVFFELTLVPMFFLIGIWGGPDRAHAAGKFFLFTFAGSVFTLAAIVYLAVRAGGYDAGTRTYAGTPSFDIADIIRYAQFRMTQAERFWVVLGLLAGFAVKVPLFPVHTWLPLAHTEAPTAGSVILAGVLLKLGTYGLLRLAIPIGLVARGQVVSPILVQVLAALSVAGIIYGALVAWVQSDIKKLVAYSSVSHLGFCVLGMVSLNDIGMGGSVLYMVNHGLSTGAMFLVIGMIYDRFHTREMSQLSGLARRMPVMSFFFVLFVMSSIGLPGLNGFVSEFLTILGAFTSPFLGTPYGIGIGVTAAAGIVLGAIYMLHMTARVLFGPALERQRHAVSRDRARPASAPGDLNWREIAVLSPLAVAVVLLGVMPNWVLGGVLGPLRAVRSQVGVEIVEKAPENGMRHVTRAGRPGYLESSGERPAESPVAAVAVVGKSK